MYTFDNDTVSDLHKDAYGFRPSQSWWYGWTHATDDQKQSNWDSLVEALKYSNQQEEIREKNAIASFEASVQDTIAAGAPDRETAIRWMFEAENYNDDMDYFAWSFCLPYNYFKKV